MILPPSSAWNSSISFSPYSAINSLCPPSKSCHVWEWPSSSSSIQDLLDYASLHHFLLPSLSISLLHSSFSFHISLPNFREPATLAEHFQFMKSSFQVQTHVQNVVILLNSLTKNEFVRSKDQIPKSVTSYSDIPLLLPNSKSSRLCSTHFIRQLISNIASSRKDHCQ